MEPLLRQGHGYMLTLGCEGLHSLERAALTGRKRSAPHQETMAAPTVLLLGCEALVAHRSEPAVHESSASPPDGPSRRGVALVLTPSASDRARSTPGDAPELTSRPDRACKRARTSQGRSAQTRPALWTEEETKTWYAELPLGSDELPRLPRAGQSIFAQSYGRDDHHQNIYVCLLAGCERDERLTRPKMRSHHEWRHNVVYSTDKDKPGLVPAARRSGRSLSVANLCRLLIVQRGRAIACGSFDGSVGNGNATRIDIVVRSRRAGGTADHGSDRPATARRRTAQKCAVAMPAQNTATARSRNAKRDARARQRGKNV